MSSESSKKKLPRYATEKVIKFSTPPMVPSIHKINAKPKRFTAISFFSGCGGGSTGLKLAGFDVLYANEFIPIAAKTYKANAPKTLVDTRDIRKVRGPEIIQRLGKKKGEIDLLESSPPCKAFSSTRARKQGGDFGEEIKYSEGVKQRVDDLFFEQLRILKEIMPKTFVFENVPGLTNKINKGILCEILDGAEAVGYKVEARIIDPSYLGLPQARRRLIFVGVRNDLVKKGFKPVFPLPEKIPAKLWDHLPHIERIKIGSGFVPANRPSPTITVADHSIGLTASFSNGGFIETKDDGIRRFTIEELKRIFGFPDDFVLLGDFKQKWERLGRSHAPWSMYHVAKSIADNILVPLRRIKEKP